jgi:predicted alpha/beta hydrolase family esterase
MTNYLIIPGLGNSGPGHWQTYFEQVLPNCSHFISIGDAGHINTAAGYGPWPQGLELLRQLG